MFFISIEYFIRWKFESYLGGSIMKKVLLGLILVLGFGLVAGADCTYSKYDLSNIKQSRLIVQKMNCGKGDLVFKQNSSNVINFVVYANRPGDLKNISLYLRNFDSSLNPFDTVSIYANDVNIAKSFISNGLVTFNASNISFIKDEAVIFNIVLNTKSYDKSFVKDFVKSSFTLDFDFKNINFHTTIHDWIEYDVK
jgi:hypothetical protein